MMWSLGLTRTAVAALAAGFLLAPFWQAHKSPPGENVRRGSETAQFEERPPSSTKSKGGAKKKQSAQKDEQKKSAQRNGGNPPAKRAATEQKTKK